jgi:hypothetical protein
MQRLVTPELLDELAPEDPRARRSRRDLMRIHWAMRSVSILRKTIAQLGLITAPRRVIELGAGDGTLLLRLARALHPAWPAVDLTLLDRVDLVSEATLTGYHRLGWNVTVQCEDVLRWARAAETEQYDLGIASLFLHHFDQSQLTVLLAAVERKTDAFVTCEPCRNALGWVGSRLVGLLGANDVTRGDAVKSVAAGFADHELTLNWPNPARAWRVEEGYAMPFTHCFAARLAGPRSGMVPHAS